MILSLGEVFIAEFITAGSGCTAIVIRFKVVLTYERRDWIKSGSE